MSPHPQYCSAQESCEEVGGYWDNSTSKCFKKSSLDNGTISQIKNNYGYMTANSAMADLKINKNDSLNLSFNFGPFDTPVNLYLAYATSDSLKFIDNNSSASDGIVPFAENITGQYAVNNAYSLNDLCSVFGSENVVFGYILAPSATGFSWDNVYDAEVGYMIFENVCNAQSVGGDVVDISEPDCRLRDYFYVWDDATSTCRTKN